MSMFEKYEARRARYSDEAAERRLQEFRNAAAMNRLEGAPESAEVEQQLFRLLATGRITEAEYLDICLTLAKGEE
jgi:hypothetical protein